MQGDAIHEFCLLYYLLRILDRASSDDDVHAVNGEWV